MSSVTEYIPEYFIYIENLSTDEKSIFKAGNCENGFVKCVSWLQKTNNEKYKYIITDDTCEIYNEIELIKNGWVWNSKQNVKNIIYKLSNIKLINTDYNIYKKTICTQTEREQEIEITNKNSSSKFNIGSFDDSIDDAIDALNQMNFKNFCQTPKLEFGDGYSKNLFNLQNDFLHELKEKLSTPHYGLNEKTKLKID